MPDPSPHCKRLPRAPIRRVAQATRVGLNEWLLFGLEPTVAKTDVLPAHCAWRACCAPPRQGAGERRIAGLQQQDLVSEDRRADSSTSGPFQARSTRTG